MSWDICRLGNVITLQRGHDLPDARRQDGSVPVVSSSGITGYHNEPKAKAPGVVTGRYGTLGEVFYLEQDYWPLNTALYVTDFKNNNPRFIAYFLRNILKNYQSDKAAVPGVNRNVLHELKVRCTDPKSQERIANFLAAYDDLIENNRRRMALLEEAARQLYKEWFVRLLFPGREHTRIVKGVPEGWERRSIATLIKRVPAGKLFSQDVSQSEGKIPILDQGRSGVIGYHDEEPSVDASEDTPLIVFSNHTCYQRVIFYPFSAIQNVLPYIPSPAYYRNIFWLHYATEGQVKTNAYKGHWPELMAKDILVPTVGIAERFGHNVRDNLLLCLAMERQNEKLSAARDLLLPKLMNGEIAV